MARILSKTGGRKAAGAATKAKAAPAKAPAVKPVSDVVKASPTPVAKAATKVKTLPLGKVKSEHGAVTIPERASDLKARFSDLAQAVGQVKALKRSFPKSFYDVGEVLLRIQNERLFEVKGYGSFEAFAERELDLGAQNCISAARIAQVLRREAALEAGFERASNAVAALDGAPESRDVGPVRHVGLAAVPLHKR